MPDKPPKVPPKQPPNPYDPWNNAKNLGNQTVDIFKALKSNGISRAQYDVMHGREQIEKWARNRVGLFKSQTQMDEGLAILLQAMGINRKKK